jgi:hypothetical protein
MSKRRGKFGQSTLYPCIRISRWSFFEQLTYTNEKSGLVIRMRCDTSFHAVKGMEETDYSHIIFWGAKNWT